MTNDNKPVLTVAELCERWMCCDRTVRDAIRSGRLRAFKIGNGTRAPYRVTIQEVERFERTKAA